MKIDEIKKKDWQVMTAIHGLQTLAFVKTIFEQNCAIISELKKIPIEQVLKDNNEHYLENYKIVSDKTMSEVPDYPELKP